MPRQTGPCMTGIHGTLTVMNEGHDRQGSVQQCSSSVDILFCCYILHKHWLRTKMQLVGMAFWGLLFWKRQPSSAGLI